MPNTLSRLLISRDPIYKETNSNVLNNLYFYYILLLKILDNFNA